MFKEGVALYWKSDLYIVQLVASCFDDGEEDLVMSQKHNNSGFFSLAPTVLEESHFWCLLGINKNFGELSAYLQSEEEVGESHG